MSVGFLWVCWLVVCALLASCLMVFSALLVCLWILVGFLLELVGGCVGLFV